MSKVYIYYKIESKREKVYLKDVRNSENKRLMAQNIRFVLKYLNIKKGEWTELTEEGVSISLN